MTTKRKTVRQRIQFAFNADTDSVVGHVFQYLIKNHHFSSREGKCKGVDAMIAFYKPFAYQGNANVNEGELQTMARDAVDALSRHIELLCYAFGVDRSTTIARDLKLEVQQVLTELLTADAVTLPGERLRIGVSQEGADLPFADTIPESLLTNGATADEGVDFDEDALLGDLYSSAEAAA